VQGAVLNRDISDEQTGRFQEHHRDKSLKIIEHKLETDNSQQELGYDAESQLKLNLVQSEAQNVSMQQQALTQQALNENQKQAPLIYNPTINQ
jgi:hypothetical protein